MREATRGDENKIHVVVRPVRFHKLPLIYTVYFEAFNDASLSNIYDVPKRKNETMTVLRTITIRFLHVLLARMSIALQIGSIVPLFQTRWDPIPFEIVVDDEIVGCCFLLRLNSRAVHLGIIGVLKTKQGLGIGTQAVEAIKEYSRKMGTRRIIAGTGPRETADFFKRCGFTHAFSEQVLFFDFT
jgi:GNAT superfamily N-acetyltransferase